MRIFTRRNVEDALQEARRTDPAEVMERECMGEITEGARVCMSKLPPHHRCVIVEEELTAAIAIGVMVGVLLERRVGGA